MNLKSLNLSCNSIQSLPREIGQLTQLETLWCNNTGLCTLPEEIGNCEHLETLGELFQKVLTLKQYFFWLGLRGNFLEVLPAGMERLVKLRWLTLENNRLFALPETLSALKNLIHLNLKSNHLKAIPVCLRYMKKLRYVFLNCNRIQDISPDVLKYLTFIRMLNICDNPFCDVESVRLQLKVKIYSRNITLTFHTKCCP